MPGLPEIAPGDDLAALIAAAAEAAVAGVRGGEVLVVAQKVVSKAEGRARARSLDVEPGARARELARKDRKGPAARPADPGRERRGASRRARGADRPNATRLRLRERRHRSVERRGRRRRAACFPRDPDASARALRAAIAERLGDAPPW